jgi:hypothetical protein
MVKAKKCNKPVIVDEEWESSSDDNEVIVPKKKPKTKKEKPDRIEKRVTLPLPAKTRPRKKTDDDDNNVDVDVNEFLPKVKRKKTLIPDVLCKPNVASQKPNVASQKPDHVDIPKKKKRAPSAYNIYIQNKMKNDTDIKVLPIKERFKACAAAYKYDKANNNL